jgi:hypothetical protein
MAENPDEKEDIENFRRIILKMDQEEKYFDGQSEEKLWLDIKNTFPSGMYSAVLTVPKNRIVKKLLIYKTNKIY